MKSRFGIVGAAATVAALAVAAPTALVANAPFFTYYSANLSATPWLTLYHADSLAAAAAAWSTFNVPSLLLLYNALFTTVPGRMILKPDYENELASLLAAAAPLRASGAVMGFNLGDELVWNCLSQANLSVAAEAVRSLCPRGEKNCVFWYNEAAVFRAGPFKDSCGNENEAFRVPPALDWFSVDIYHMDGIVPGWVRSKVGGFYDVRFCFCARRHCASVGLLPPPPTHPPTPLRAPPAICFSAPRRRSKGSASPGLFRLWCVCMKLPRKRARRAVPRAHGGLLLFARSFFTPATYPLTPTPIFLLQT